MRLRHFLSLVACCLFSVSLADEEAQQQQGQFLWKALQNFQQKAKQGRESLSNWLDDKGAYTEGVYDTTKLAVTHKWGMETVPFRSCASLWVSAMEDLEKNEKEKKKCFVRYVPMSTAGILESMRICFTYDKVLQLHQLKLYASQDPTSDCTVLHYEVKKKKVLVFMIGNLRPDKHKCPALPILLGIVKGVSTSLLEVGKVMYLEAYDAASPAHCSHIKMTDLSLLKYGDPFYVHTRYPLLPSKALTLKTTYDEEKKKVSLDLDLQWLAQYCRVRKVMKNYGQAATLEKVAGVPSGPVGAKPRRRLQRRGGAGSVCARHVKVFEDFVRTKEVDTGLGSDDEADDEWESLKTKPIKELLRDPRFHQFVEGKKTCSRAADLINCVHWKALKSVKDPLVSEKILEDTKNFYFKPDTSFQMFWEGQDVTDVSDFCTDHRFAPALAEVEAKALALLNPKPEKGTPTAPKPNPPVPAPPSDTTKIGDTPKEKEPETEPEPLSDEEKEKETEPSEPFHIPVMTPTEEIEKTVPEGKQEEEEEVEANIEEAEEPFHIPVITPTEEIEKTVPEGKQEEKEEVEANIEAPEEPFHVPVVTPIEVAENAVTKGEGEVDEPEPLPAPKKGKDVKGVQIAKVKPFDPNPEPLPNPPNAAPKKKRHGETPPGISLREYI
uniref:Uncharacterized protein n=1 Tax=Chromera velia CCMP2878 TaxID=1169474 RepID=A0A0G4GRE6_9ALVE|eukprot:Cvel_23044.t1-p1 / transcript=Cvel_23044.t1 / gene=Cvel_23044 / organism=Chromera_velia_CCMP2878 / gene_product=hypothetical protein / transcript_product=hypothetical protein / location=Cvel_scaffold2330:15938-20640(-) / protein_length=664 / sequence_SO=supercontig / SO=protein_coding / is_pseudo=false